MLARLFCRFAPIIGEAELFSGPLLAVPPPSFGVSFVRLELLAMFVVVRERVIDVTHGEIVFASDDVGVIVVVHDAMLNI